MFLAREHPDTEYAVGLPMHSFRLCFSRNTDAFARDTRISLLFHSGLCPISFHRFDAHDSETCGGVQASLQRVFNKLVVSNVL